MAEIKIPKNMIDDLRESTKAKLKQSLSEMEKIHLKNVVDEPSWAILEVLRPHLKGDLLYLSQKISYGDIEAVDEGDGYLRIEIPDENLSTDLPFEIGNVKVQPEKPKSFFGRERDELLKDLATMSAPLLVETKDGGSERVGAFFRSCAPAFSQLLGDTVTTDELMALYAEIFHQYQGTVGPQDVLDASDRASEKLADDDRVALVMSLLDLAGISPQKPPEVFAVVVIDICCLQLGVLWNRDQGTLSIDPAGMIKKIALKVHR